MPIDSSSGSFDESLNDDSGLIQDLDPQWLNLPPQLPEPSADEEAPRPRQGRLARLCRRFVLAIATLAVILAILIWGGPLVSGGLLLAWPPAAHPIDHHRDLMPVHRGHVDESSGIYVREDDDLLLTKGVAFALRRTYMSVDRQNRQFGIGTSSNADWYIIGDADRFQWAAVILADGSRIRFERTSSGTSYMNARFEHRESPTFFYGSQLAWNGTGWTLRLADGTIHTFSDCGPNNPGGCRLIKTRDPDGHVLKFERGTYGTLHAIDADGARFTFDNDESGRVVAINDGWRDIVRYSYDTAGRLATAAMADGVVRRYSYGPRDELVKIEEPGRVIDNTFDTESRLVHQVLRRPDSPDYVMDWAYTTIDGQVRETLVTDNVGQRTLRRWDERRYELFESRESPPWQPALMTFNRSEGGFLRSVSLRCVGPRGRVDGTYEVPATYYNPDEYTDYLFEQLCGVPEP